MIFRRPKPATPWKLIGIGVCLLAVLFIGVRVIDAVAGGDRSGNSAQTFPSPTPSQVVTTESQIAPAEAVTPSAAPVPAVPVVTAITVDELLDKLNSAEMGGIKVGDQFRLAGELFMSKQWMTGAAGEYNVLLMAQEGAQDLSVFVNEADAAKWQDGTKVEMVVEMGEATINGETTDGWLRAVSAETVP